MWEMNDIHIPFKKKYGKKKMIENCLKASWKYFYKLLSFSCHIQYDIRFNTVFIKRYAKKKKNMLGVYHHIPNNQFSIYHFLF